MRNAVWIFLAISLSVSARPCDDALARADATYAAKMEELKKKEQAQRAEFEKELSKCDYGKAGEECRAEATAKHEEQRRKLQLERDDENTRHLKERIDIEHTDACMDPLPAGPACERTKAVEDRRYARAMAELEKREADVRNRSDHRLSDCRGDLNCIDAAARKTAVEMAEVRDLEEDEGEQHKQARRDIERSCAVAKKDRESSDLAKIGCPECPCVDLSSSRLQVDQLIKDRSAREYNCFFYVKTFIEGRPHAMEPYEKVHGEAFADNDYMARQKYAIVGKATDLNSFKAQLGDIIAVEGNNAPTIWRPWVHIAVVTSVDANGRILSTRQKPDPTHCVTDLSPSQFSRVYPVSGNDRYVLYRSDYLPGRLPRAR